MNPYESFKMAHPTTAHPPSHTLCEHLAQPLPLPIRMSSNLASTYPTNSTARRRIFAASSIKLGLSSVYNPYVMLVISLGSVSLAPFSLDPHKTSSPLLDHFPAFLVELEATFRETEWRRTTLTKLYSLKQGSKLPSMLPSFVRSRAISAGMTKPYATIFIKAPEMMSRLFS